MQRARETGRNSYQFYAPQMNQRVVERMELESSLRHALDRKEFLLHFQPKLSADMGHMCGAEALLRWRHPQRGLVSPADFIPVLEETGLILPVGLWVLETACAQLRHWQDAGLPTVPIAINLSARQFQQADLDERVNEILHRHGISPTMIELELTESMLMHDPAQATRTLGKLKHTGVRLSVDDFGTGYSSLAYLKQFPLDTLKIDRAFIKSIPHDPNDVAIALAIVNLAHNLNLDVVAEGVETDAQARFLIEQGCDILQGFCFSRPVDADAFTTLLEKGEPRLPPPAGKNSLETESCAK
jgi:EAL domain-containing protein (putative c-di-GMP-specific phosphodiesterase class I)